MVVSVVQKGISTRSGRILRKMLQKAAFEKSLVEKSTCGIIRFCFNNPPPPRSNGIKDEIRSESESDKARSKVK